MLLSELTVTCGCSILGLHSRTTHTGRQALGRTLKETTERETLVRSATFPHCALFSLVFSNSLE